VARDSGSRSAHPLGVDRLRRSWRHWHVGVACSSMMLDDPRSQLLSGWSLVQSAKNPAIG
jgi:hypothetical protein